MRIQKSVAHIARFVLESTTPLSICTGRSNGIFDSLLVRDANGLPGIPGTSLAGVLRHLAVRYHTELAALFGSAIKDEESPSNVHVSWGCIHDENDKPVEGLVLDRDEVNLKSEILAAARDLSPLRRDRVRLDRRGVAQDAGQFDRTALPAGYRFSAELIYWNETHDNQAWQNLLGLLQNPEMRLGGATRSGYGGLKLVRLHQRHFKLNDKYDYRDWRELGTNLSDTAGLQEHTGEEKSCQPRVVLQLQAEDGYRFGDGDQALEHNEEKDPTIVPVTEKRVIWDGPKARFSQRHLLVPGSGVKGALRHRFAFHYQRHAKKWAENPDNQHEIEDCEGVRRLFGFAANTKDTNQQEGHAGHLIFSDVYIKLEEKAYTLPHNGIDRYTGGVRHGVLFAEQVCKAPIELNVTVCDPGNDRLKDTLLRPALRDTLKDLTEGRLALGAGRGRGWGYFTGRQNWSDNAAWLHGGHHAE